MKNQSIEALIHDVEELEMKKREKKRELRNAQKKQAQHRNYVVGEIVINLFPELAEIIPGNKDENSEKFGWFKETLQNTLFRNELRTLFLKYSQRYR